MSIYIRISTVEARTLKYAVPQPQRLEKKENQHKLSQALIPTFWSLLTAYMAVYSRYSKQRQCVIVYLQDLESQWRFDAALFQLENVVACCFELLGFPESPKTVEESQEPGSRNPIKTHFKSVICRWVVSRKAPIPLS